MNEERLKPGDLCQIVDHPDWKSKRNRQFLGRVVILVEVLVRDAHIRWIPYWRVIGLPPMHYPSQHILRKLPPPRLEDENDTNIGCTRHHELT
jgi:hypothetical protein